MRANSVTYETQLDECLRRGHVSMEWRFASTRRAWCSRCSRSWPIEWLQLLEFQKIEPIDVPARIHGRSPLQARRR